MTELMKKAFEAASRLPADRQEELAHYLLELSQGGAAAALSADEATAVAEAEAELTRGERVPQAEIDAFWRRNGL